MKEQVITSLPAGFMAKLALKHDASHTASAKISVSKVSDKGAAKSLLTQTPSDDWLFDSILFDCY